MLYFSLTFNKLKDNEPTRQSSTRAPWWSTFTKVTVTDLPLPTIVPDVTPPTSSVSNLMTEATTTVTTTAVLDNKQHNSDYHIKYNTVRFQPVPSMVKHNNASKPQFLQPHSSNTIGKLINVTGDKIKNH